MAVRSQPFSAVQPSERQASPAVGGWGPAQIQPMSQPIILNNPSTPMQPHRVRPLIGQLAAAAALVALPWVSQAVPRWWQRWQRGPLPVARVSGVVGHDDSAAQPTTLLALNIDRQVVVMELPGGDAAKMTQVLGPYLVGADADRTPVALALADIDHDGHADLTLTIAGEQFIYRNIGPAFQLATTPRQP